MSLQPSYIYRCMVTKVVDGDTVDVNLLLGFSISYHNRVRLRGLDTPESRTRNLKEKKLGLAAKQRLKELIASAGKVGKRKDIILQTHRDGKGKFGRILGELYVNGKSVNVTLIEEGHARDYWGGAKESLGPWTKEVDGEWQRWTKEGYVAYDSPRTLLEVFRV